MVHGQNNKFKNQYLVYTRRSTDDANNQKNSISYQKLEILKFAEKEHLLIATVDIDGFCKNGIISERHTGFKEDDYFSISNDGKFEFKIERPKFAKLAELLFSGHYKGVIFLCWDRASRNKNDNNIIDKLEKRGVDLRYAWANYDDSSSGALHKDIDGMFAEHHSRVTSEKVKTTYVKLRNEGVCTYRAPIGYINTGDLRNKPFDPVRAPIVKQLFEKYADGTWSLHDLARWANEQGLTMPAIRRKRTKEEKLLEEEEEIQIEAIERPINFKHLHYIFHNKFYLGYTIGNDKKLVKSISHQALVTPELFSKVQEVLLSKKVSLHYIQKPFFQYRGIIRCKQCGRVYTPYEKKGTHYYSARCVDGCPNTKKSINALFIESEAQKIISGLYITATQYAAIDQQIKNDNQRYINQQYTEQEEYTRKEHKLKEDLSYLQANKLQFVKGGLYSPEEFMAEEKRLIESLEDIKGKIGNKTSPIEVSQSAQKLSEQLKKVELYYKKGNADEKARFLRSIFSELNILDNRLVYKVKKAFHVLELPFVLTGVPNNMTSELLEINTGLKEGIEELESLLNSI